MKSNEIAKVISEIGSFAEIATLMGVAVGTIFNWVHGISTPKEAQKQKLINLWLERHENR